MNNIILIGMRGAGKSNISRRLSVLTKRPVISTDLMISYENQGRSIPQILADNGGDWHAFRRMEGQVVEKAARLDGVIIDCGGGVVVDLDPAGAEIFGREKIDRLRASGLLIWLKGEISTLAAKTRSDASRPSLSDALDAETLMRRRLPFYEEAADMVVEIDGRKRSHLAQEIVQRLPFPARAAR